MVRNPGCLRERASQHRPRVALAAAQLNRCQLARLSNDCSRKNLSDQHHRISVRRRPGKAGPISSGARQPRTSAKADVNIDARVGVAVPRNITLVEIPEEVVVIVPEWRRYKYVLIGDEICIVDPDSYEILEVSHRKVFPARIPPLGGLALFAAWNKSLFAEFFHRCSPLRACAMEPNVTPIERAFELARLGIFLFTEIKERMREEGYFTESITGRTLLNQLQGVMQMARKSRWKRARTC